MIEIPRALAVNHFLGHDMCVQRNTIATSTKHLPVHMRGVITHNQAGSPIWMRPGQTTYDRAAEATAKRFAACAGQLIKHNFDTRKAGTLDDGTRCKFTPLGVPFDTAPPRPRTTP